MTSWIEPTKPYLDHEHHLDCPGCQTPLAITVIRQKGHDEPEECRCPACGYEFIYRACQSPTVRVR